MGSVYSARYKFFLQRLREARLDAGLTQVQVARAFRTTQNHISKCERGDRRVDVVELWEFANLYGKPLDYFFDKESSSTGEGPAVSSRTAKPSPPRSGRSGRTGRR